jgi:hypothetical protein
MSVNLPCIHASWLLAQLAAVLHRNSNGSKSRWMAAIWPYSVMVPLSNRPSRELNTSASARACSILSLISLTYCDTCMTLAGSLKRSRRATSEASDVRFSSNTFCSWRMSAWYARRFSVLESSSSWMRSTIFLGNPKRFQRATKSRLGR